MVFECHRNGKEEEFPISTLDISWAAVLTRSFKALLQSLQRDLFQQTRTVKKQFASKQGNAHWPRMKTMSLRNPLNGNTRSKRVTV